MRISPGMLLLVATLAVASTGLAQTGSFPRFRGALAQQTPTAAKPGISLDLRAVQDEVPTGSPVKVKLITTNVTDHRLTLYYEYLGTYALNLDVHVRNGKGAHPPDTKTNRKIKSQTGRTGGDVSHYQWTQSGSH